MSPPCLEDSSDRICIFYTSSESCPCRRQATTWSHQAGEDYPNLLHGRFSKEQWEEFLAARDAAYEPVEESQRRFNMIFFPLLIFTALAFVSWFILPMLGVPIWLLMAAWALGFSAALTVACVFECKDLEGHFFETLVREWKEQFKEANLDLRNQSVTVGSGKKQQTYCWIEITCKDKKRAQDAESSSSSSSSSAEDAPCWLTCFKVTGNGLLILFVILGCLYGFIGGVVSLHYVNDRVHGTCIFPDSANGCAEVTTTPSPSRRVQEEQAHEPQTRKRNLLTVRRQLLSCEDGLTWSCNAQKYAATKSRSAYTNWQVSWPNIRFEPKEFTLSTTSCTLLDPAYNRMPTAEGCKEKGLQRSRDPATCYHYSDYEDECWLGDTSTTEFYVAVLLIAWGIVSWCMALTYCAWRKRVALRSVAVSLGIVEGKGPSTDVDETSDEGSEGSEASDSNDKQKSASDESSEASDSNDKQKSKKVAEEGPFVIDPVVVAAPVPGSVDT